MMERMTEERRRKLAAIERQIVFLIGKRVKVHRDPISRTDLEGGYVVRDYDRTAFDTMPRGYGLATLLVEIDGEKERRIVRIDRRVGTRRRAS